MKLNALDEIEGRLEAIEAQLVADDCGWIPMDKPSVNVAIGDLAQCVRILRDAMAADSNLVRQIADRLETMEG